MLRMFNMIKRKQIYPQIFQSANISSFYKKTGNKSDLNNDRGVFNLVKIRSIHDKLVYSDIYGIVDASMSQQAWGLDVTEISLTIFLSSMVFKMMSNKIRRLVVMLTWASMI